jgi:acyl-coenzyme A synthetase/AMP-(fatty) acid ligase
MSGVSLLGKRAGSELVAVRGDASVAVDDYLRDVARLTELLPDRAYVVNLCADRYQFAVALASAMCRRQICLLPPAQTPQLLRSLAQRYPGLYALCDGPSDVPLEGVICPSADEKSSAPATELAFPAEQIAAIAFTSGSTGEPTPHAKTWGHLMAGAASEASRFGLRGVQHLTVVGTVPAQHMYGFESTVLMALHNGLALYAGRPFYPADVRIALEQLGGERVLVTTPVHLRALLAEEQSLPPLRLIVCATAPLAPTMAAEAEARYGAPVHEVYGFTEAGMVATRRTTEGPVWHALPGVELREEQSAVWVSGGHVPAPVAATDVLQLGTAHTFILHGRNADLINVAGKRTSLAYLNQQLSAIAGVQDAVFHMPEDNANEVTRVMAFVVAPGLSRAEVLSALRERIDAAFLPRPLYLVDALPRNATGKITREALVELARTCAASAPSR